MALQKEVREVDGIQIVTVLESAITHHQSAALKEAIFMEIARGNYNIILDLSQVTQMDSSGIGALLFGKRQANAQEGDLRLIGVAESIQKILQIAQLTRIFEIFDTEEEAINAFKS